MSCFDVCGCTQSHMLQRSRPHTELCVGITCKYLGMWSGGIFMQKLKIVMQVVNVMRIIPQSNWDSARQYSLCAVLMKCDIDGNLTVCSMAFQGTHNVSVLVPIYIRKKQGRRAISEKTDCFWWDSNPRHWLRSRQSTELPGQQLSRVESRYTKQGPTRRT